MKKGRRGRVGAKMRRKRKKGYLGNCTLMREPKVIFEGPMSILF